MIRWDKVRTVAIFELTSAIRRTGFLVVTFGMPLFMAAYGAIVAVPAYYAGKRDRARPSVFGVVDRPQLLHLHADTSPPKGEIDSDAKRLLEQTGQSGAVDRMLPRSSFVFRPFAGEAEARASLARRDLRGYFVLTDDYLQTGIVEAYATDGFNVSQSDARNAFGVLVRQELLRGQVAPGIAARVTTPLPDVRRFAVSRNGELKDGGEAASVVRFALPVAFTVLFLMSVLMTSGYLLQGTATEKENKVVEVLLASANPDEILAGKLAGLCATGLVQVGVWISMLFLTGFGAVPLLFAAHVDLPWRALLVALPFFIVAFLFFGSLMLGSGSIGSNMREAQQLSMVWSLTAALPLMLLSVLIREPHGLVARILTWLPLTAGPVVVMRASMDADSLAWWEMVGPLLVLLGATWIALRIGARLFRVGLLSSGARPSLREVMRQARLADR
jgi:ABC-2 type transport system permease protein